MRFPVKFSRYITAVPPGGKVLGSDALLVDGAGNPRKPTVNDDNVLTSRISSINGWPLSRICVYAIARQAAPVVCNIACYAYEDQMGCWLPLTGSATTITPGLVTAPTAPVFFDNLSLIDNPKMTAQLENPEPGANSFLLIVSAGANPSGQYDFIMGPELTSKPF